MTAKATITGKTGVWWSWLNESIALDFLGFT